MVVNFKKYYLIYCMHKDLAANLFYQVSVLLSQFLLMLFLFFQYGNEGVDSFFLHMALMLPLYTFLQLGLRQLRLSLVLGFWQFFIIRFIAVFVFIALLFFIVDFSQDIVHVVVFLKVSDMLLEVILVECQLAKLSNKVFYLSIYRVLVFILYGFVFSYGVFSLYLLVLPSLILFFLSFFIFYKAKGFNESVPIYRMIYMGVTGCVSSLIISYPRVVLGQAEHVDSGILSAVSLISYVSLIGGMGISSFIPKILPKLSQCEHSQVQIYIKKYLLFFVLCVSVSLSVLYVFLSFFLWLYNFKLNYYILLIVMFFSVFLNLTTAFIEYFSSIGRKERYVMINSFVVLFLSFFLARDMAGAWNGLGYAVVITVVYLTRFSISWFFVVKRG